MLDHVGRARAEMLRVDLWPPVIAELSVRVDLLLLVCRFDVFYVTFAKADARSFLLNPVCQIKSRVL